MDISFYLVNYIQSRISSGATSVDFYIADCLRSKEAEIIIKDDGTKIDDEGVEVHSLADFCSKMQGQHQLLYHRGESTLNLSWPIQESSTSLLSRLHSLLGVMMINHIRVRIVFSYLSKRGDYVLDSSNFHQMFDENELMQKELLVYMNELLENHLSDVRDCL